MCDFQVMTRSRTEFLTGNLHMTPFNKILSGSYIAVITLLHLLFKYV